MSGLSSISSSSKKIPNEYSKINSAYKGNFKVPFENEVSVKEYFTKANQGIDGLILSIKDEKAKEQWTEVKKLLDTLYENYENKLINSEYLELTDQVEAQKQINETKKEILEKIEDLEMQLNAIQKPNKTYRKVINYIKRFLSIVVVSSVLVLAALYSPQIFITIIVPMSLVFGPSIVQGWSELLTEHYDDPMDETWSITHHCKTAVTNACSKWEEQQRNAIKNVGVMASAMEKKFLTLEKASKYIKQEINVRSIRTEEQEELGDSFNKSDEGILANAIEVQVTPLLAEIREELYEKTANLNATINELKNHNLYHSDEIQLNKDSLKDLIESIGKSFKISNEIKKDLEALKALKTRVESLESENTIGVIEEWFQNENKNLATKVDLKKIEDGINEIIQQQSNFFNEQSDQYNAQFDSNKKIIDQLKRDTIQNSQNIENIKTDYSFINGAIENINESLNHNQNANAAHENKTQSVLNQLREYISSVEDRFKRELEQLIESQNSFSELLTDELQDKLQNDISIALRQDEEFVTMILSRFIEVLKLGEVLGLGQNQEASTTPSEIILESAHTA